MNEILWFVVGLAVGIYPAYLYGRIQGINWATRKTKELLRQYGLVAFDVE